MSIWARNLVDEQVEKETQEILQQFYSELSSGTKDTIQTLDSLAESVCQELSLEYGSTDLENIEDAPTETYQAASTASKLLELIENGTDFESSRLNSVISNVSTWTQRGVAVVPLLGSMSEVYAAACTVSAQQAVPTTEQIQDLLLSLTMFIVELLLTYYGVTSKISRLVVTAMDKYLLGLLKQTLGLEMYIFLLRESLVLLYDDIENVLSTIEGLTEDIDELNDEFFTDKEKDQVDDLDTRQDLFDTEFLDDSHTCKPE